MTTAKHTLDARGLNCPLPILRTRKALAALETGDVLQVLATDPGSTKDLASFCEQTGNQLLTTAADRDEFSFLIRKV